MSDAIRVLCRGCWATWWDHEDCECTCQPDDPNYEAWETFTIEGWADYKRRNPDPLVERWARISDDGMYRYVLGRRWGPADGRRLTWVMLNPSVADAHIDDHTIRRCVYYSQREGFDELVVVNLYAYRTPDPDELRHANDPDGPDNASYLDQHLTEAEAVVVAWGVHPMARARDGLIVDRRSDLLCLGVTADGYPRHPSRLPNARTLQAWP